MSGAVHRRGAILVAAALFFFVGFWKLRLYDPGIQIDSANYDTYVQLLPMWEQAAQSMRGGELPLWNPYQACGHPILASLLYGVLYPLHAAWLVLDPGVVLEISTALHLFLAWLFTYLFARACGLSRLAGAVAGLGFALSGIVVQEAIWYAPAIDSAVWLPLGLFAMEKLTRERRWKWMVVLAVCVAMPVYAGWLQNLLYLAQALALYAAVRLLAMVRRGGWRAAAATAVMAGAGVALGVALSAAQLLPSLELSALSTRGSGEFSTGAMFPYPPPAPSALLTQAFDARPGPPRLSYVGIVPLVLLPAALWTRRRRASAAALFVLAAFGLLAMFTRYTPFWNLYSALPGVALFRIPWRAALIYAFASSGLAGFGFDALAREGPRRRRLMAAACAVLALPSLLIIDMPDLSRGYIVAAVALAVAAAWLPASHLRRGSLTVIAALIAVELFLATWSPALSPIRGASIYDKEASLFASLREKAGLDRVYIHAVVPAGPEVTPKIATLQRVYTITDYENLSLQRQAFFFAGMDPLVRKIGYYPLPFDGDFHVEPEAGNLRMVSLLSVRFLAVKESDAIYRHALEEAGWSVAFSPAGSAYVAYENPHPLPRAYVSINYAVMNGADSLKTVWRKRFDPFRSTVLEPPAGEILQSVGSGPPIVPAMITRYESTRVDIETHSSQPGFLVLTDADYPGWRAEVDGAPAKIVTANYLFRAVPVGAGPHRVTFTYAPSSVRWGLAATFAAVLMAVVGLSRDRGSAAAQARAGAAAHASMRTGEGGAAGLGA